MTANENDRLKIEGVNCYGEMSNPQRIVRVTIDDKSVDIDANLLEKMLVQANREALSFY